MAMAKSVYLLLDSRSKPDNRKILVSFQVSALTVFILRGFTTMAFCLKAHMVDGKLIRIACFAGKLKPCDHPSRIYELCRIPSVAVNVELA